MSTNNTHNDILDKIKICIHEVDPQAEVWLYGSRARGTAREDSDWDVLVLSPKDTISNREEGAFIDHVTDMMVENNIVVQLLAYGKKDWHTRHSVTSFYKNVQHDAIRL